MNKKVIALLLVLLISIRVLPSFADAIKIPQWPFKESACLVVRSTENILTDRKTLYDYNNAVMPNETATVTSENLIFFHLNNYVETDLGIGIKNDISNAELVITNASKRLYEIKYPVDEPRGIKINGGSQIKSIPSFLEYIVVPANVLYGKCEANLTITRNDESTEAYKFYIDVQAKHLSLSISEIDIREVNHHGGIKIGHIFLKGIEGLIGFSDPDITGEISVISMNGTECYIENDASLQQLFGNESIHNKHDSIDIPFRYDGLQHQYQVTIPKGLLLLENGLNKEYTLNFEVDIDVEDYILNHFPENGSVIMMDEATQIQPITIDIAKPCEIADDMKVFANRDSIEYNISDERDYYRIFFDLEIESGKSYTISFEENTITLPNGVKNKRTIGIFFDTVLKGSVDIFDSTSFRDLPEYHWAYNYISELAQKGIISGYEDGTFKPEDYITRGELAKLLSVAFNQKGTDRSKYSDIENHWAKSYIESTQQFIPIRDKTELLFHPNEYATREEVAASIALLIDVSQDVIVNSANNATTFLDESEIREELRANVNFAVYLGIIYGYDGNVFKPHDNITRSEIAAMICRSLEID